MKIFTLISVALMSSFIISCATEQKSLLEERAGYNNPMPPLQMGMQKGPRMIPKRVPERVIVAWLHPHELPSKDYFWGSWISIVVTSESWEMIKDDSVTFTNDLINKKLKAKSPPEEKVPKGGHLQ